jgi:peptidoglycan-associated lipoprotein
MTHRGLLLTALTLLALGTLAGCATREPKTGVPGESPGASPDLAALTDPGATERDLAVVGRATVRRPVLREYIPVVDLKDIHFDFDRAEIRPDDARLLDLNADWLRRHPRLLLLIEGHADERGTPEYNLALGERRARNAMNYLISRGVAADRITVISYGEDRPLCRESTEACWAENRRAHFAVRAP